MLESDDAATQARKALELTLRVGDVLLTAGMSANDVVVDMLRITEAYGLKRVHVHLDHSHVLRSADHRPHDSGAHRPTRCPRLHQGAAGPSARGGYPRWTASGRCDQRSGKDS